jgi:uncharacterized protein (DUF885 family)
MGMILLLTLASPVLGQSVRLREGADSMLALMRSQGIGSSWAGLNDGARSAAQLRVDRIGAILQGVDTAELTDPADRLLYANVREAVEAATGMRACRSYLWSFSNQFNGWHVRASNAARVQQVATDAQREQALTSLAALITAMHTERELLQRGLDSGYTMSRDVVRTVVQQLGDLLPASPTASPLYAPAERDSSTSFRSRYLMVLRDSIYPAAAGHRRFLQNEYLPRARPTGSLATLPDGRVCYGATLRQQTSTAIDLDALREDARRDVDRMLASLAPLVRALTGETDVGRGIIRLRASPEFSFTHRDSILPAYQAMTALAATRIDRVVEGLAPESLAVAPYPEFQERANLPPQYLRAPDDGSRPAQFLVNLGRTERMSVANAVAHEAYPGHHLQRIAAVRAPTAHPVMRSIGVGGFTEGWGIYAEDLANDMGLYTSVLDSVGAMVHMLDVAVAAWLDVSYHSLSWTRDQLVDSMVVLGGRPRAMAEAYADRHAATPGQLATYYVGYRAIREARAEAERALGARFRAPAFHYEVLRDGSVTLSSMREKVRHWIDDTRREFGTR